MNNLYFKDVGAIAEIPFPWDTLLNKTVLLSGGTGFLGSALIDVFRYRNENYNNRIKVISLSRNPQKDSDSTVLYLKHDVKNAITCDRADFVIHFASNTHPAQYAKDPVGTIDTNIFGCKNMLDFAVKAKAEKFLLASSVEIYGDGEDAPMDENYCGYLNCNTARAGYNESKRLSESLCASYKEQYGTNYSIIRFARCFGPDSKKDTKAIAQFFDNILSDKNIVLKSDGGQRYSFCYFADAINGLLTTLFFGKSGEAYNVADDDEGKTLSDYAKLIASFAQKQVVFDFEACNAGTSKAYKAILSCDKIKKIGYTPLFSVSEGMKRTYDIYKQNLI